MIEGVASSQVGASFGTRPQPNVSQGAEVQQSGAVRPEDEQQTAGVAGTGGTGFSVPVDQNRGQTLNISV